MAVTESIGLPVATDERLARQVARDDRAFVTIYERHHQTLYRYCRALLRNETDAQDAAQSTWTRALIALRRGNRDAPLTPWLLRIAHNESISQVRRRAHHRAVADAEHAQGLADAGPESASAEQQAIDREGFTELVDDLHELPDRLRGALLMRELGGLSHDEIASTLGTSVGAAKQSILEARRGLQEFAAGRELICDEVTRRVSDGDRRTLRGRQIRAHLRVCEPCSAFAAAIEGRRRTLRAYAPTLAAPAAAAGLAHALGASGATGATATGAGASATAGVATTAGLAGAGGPSVAVVAVAGKSATTALLGKALAGVAVAVLAAGATAHVLAGAHHHARPSADHRQQAAGARRTPDAPRAGRARHELVAAVGLPDRRDVGASAAGTAAASRSRPRGVEHRIASAAPVSDRHTGGRSRQADHVPARTLMPPGLLRAPTRPTHTPNGPAHVPARPIQTPPGATRVPTAPIQAPPGRSRTAPGRPQAPPGQTRTPPGQPQIPPGQVHTPSSETQVPPADTDGPVGHVHTSPRHIHIPPGQSDTPPGQSDAPPGQSDTPPGQNNTPPGQNDTPPGQAHTPAGQTDPSGGDGPASSGPTSSGATTAPVDGAPSSGDGGGATPGHSGTTAPPSGPMSSPTSQPSPSGPPVGHDPKSFSK